MLQEYLEEKLKKSQEYVEKAKKKLEDLQKEEENIRKELYKIQNESDIEFELFSPRTAKIPLREQEVELNGELWQVMDEIVEIRESVEEEEKEYQQIQEMLQEYRDLEWLANN